MTLSQPLSQSPALKRMGSETPPDLPKGVWIVATYLFEPLPKAAERVKQK